MEQIQAAVTDVIRGSNDKVVEIRPANTSSGPGKLPLLVLIGGALAFGYWLRKSENPARKIQNVASKAADRTEQASEQAAQTIEEGGETMAERVEEESQKASEQVQRAGENAAEQTERAGETAAEKAQQTGSGSSDGSSSS